MTIFETQKDPFDFYQNDGFLKDGRMSILIQKLARMTVISQK